MESQLERVRRRIEERGTISRNECLSTYPAITRLSARILDLIDEGYKIEGKQRGGDYIYTLVAVPEAKQLALAMTV